MLPLYYRLSLTQEFMTLLFRAADKSVICRSTQSMRPACESVLPVPLGARQRILSLADTEQQRRGKRIGSVEAFRQADPESTFIIDGVEQPRRKPKAPAKRHRDYSGEQQRRRLKPIHRHTLRHDR